MDELMQIFYVVMAIPRSGGVPKLVKAMEYKLFHIREDAEEYAKSCNERFHPARFGVFSFVALMYPVVDVPADWDYSLGDNES